MIPWTAKTHGHLKGRTAKEAAWDAKMQRRHMRRAAKRFLGRKLRTAECATVSALKVVSA